MVQAWNEGLYFAGGMRWLGFANYLFVWSGIFLLGYAWLDNRFPDRRMLLVYAALGLLALLSPVGDIRKNQSVVAAAAS